MTAALIAICVSAQQAVIANSTFYIQQFPRGGNAAGTLATVTPEDRFSDDFRKTGPTLGNPLFFGCSLTSNPD
ncbi:hypothetical protein F4801DRAFT_583744 [Xylaria longipes]|nr:hypothetical protein F4801DRAFT_583744 [Xylaria longipes]